ncbi:unnamed protein product [Ectocarpus sp. 12 AP-2014]
MVCLLARLVVAAATMVVNSFLAATATGVVNVEIVEDLNFADLADAVQGHPFLAVAFYSPGCGHCRRLLPSWTQAAQLMEDQRLPIRLARMDVSSRGGMHAWKAFGLTRLPTVKVFVGNNPDEPLPYAGHLDANGIAAHLAMLERDRRRVLEHQKKYFSPATTRLGDSSRGGGDGSGASDLGISKLELDKSGVILVSLAVRSNTAADDVSGRLSSRTMSLADRFRAAVGQGASLVLFAPEPSPKARRMIKEIRKAAPILALRDPPTKVILVDLQNADGGGGDNGSRGTAVLYEDGSRRRQGSSRSGDPALPPGTEDILAKRQLAADAGVTFGDGPELRIFLDGRLWVEGGVFRGLPTTDGILQHMDWVADEAGLRPQRERATTKATQRGGRSTFDGRQIITISVATAESSINVSSEACPASSRCVNHAGGVTCQDEKWE